MNVRSFGKKKTVVYDEEIKRELNGILMHECRCDEGLKGKAEASTRLAFTGWRKGSCCLYYKR